ncbi:MAG: hypothetical protein ACE3JU_26440 [Paenibacillus sp.]|uniref:hypothetical protein n=1 Tax=Paenibacillus sp. TaxID=58172 RepID=UPI003B7E6BB0
MDGHEQEEAIKYRTTFLKQIDELLPYHVIPHAFPSILPNENNGKSLNEPTRGPDKEAESSRSEHTPSPEIPTTFESLESQFNKMDTDPLAMHEKAFKIPNCCTSNGHKPIMFLTHDESTFNANDGVRYAWSHPDHSVLYAKGRGKGLMSSDVLTPFGRLIIPPHITDEEILAAGIPQRQILGSDEMEIRCDAAEYLEYGKDNYCNGEKMFDHIIKIVVPIFALVYPNFQPVFLFENTTNHSCFAENALNARIMNWGPGGDQPIMQEAMIYEKARPQPMTTNDGVPKRIEQVLRERDLLREGLRADCSSNSCDSCRIISNTRAKACTALVKNSACILCTMNLYTKAGTLWKHAQRILCIPCTAKMSQTPLPPRNCKDCLKLRRCRDANTKKDGCCGRRILSLQKDFLRQKGKLQETLEQDHGSIVLFYPKFHCELNWIENYWGWSKRRVRIACGYTLDGLRTNVPAIVASCPNSIIYKFFLRTHRMIDAYRDELPLNSAEFKQQVYKY